MKYWFDTEFIDNGNTLELISLGIISEDGRTYYAENHQCKLDTACEWVKENVIKQLGLLENRKSREQIKQDLIIFTAQDPNPIFWAWYGAYDWVAISQLFGRMLDVPVNWPHLVMDVKQLCVMLGNPKVPEQKTTKHHALNDAIWTKEVYNFLVKKLSN